MKHFANVFWELVRPNRRNFVRFFFVIALYELVKIASSYTLSLFIEANTNPAFLQWFQALPFLGQYVSETSINFILAGIVLIYAELYLRFDQKVDWKIIFDLMYPVYLDLKKSSFAKFMEMDIPWHREQKSGALVGKVQQGTTKMTDFILNLGFELIPTMIQFILSLVPIAIFIPTAVPILLGGFVIFINISFRQYKEQRPSRQRRHKGYEDEQAAMQESVMHVEALQLFRKTRTQQSSHADILKREIHEQSLISEQMGIYKYGGWRIRTIEILRITVLMLLIFQLQANLISIATTLFVWTLSEKLIHSFWRIARLMDNAAENLESAERVLKLLQQMPAVKDPETPDPLPEAPYEVAFTDVEFTYPGDKNGNGLHNLNLTISTGETIGIVGPSGAGKTTLRRMITRNYDPCEGSLSLNGVDIRQLRKSDLRSCIAYVPQGEEAAIFAETFLFNICLGLPADLSEEEKMQRATDAAKRAGIHEFILETNDGYKTVLGERGLQLSGGQRQRVALARALAADASILVLDEATSALDSLTEADIQAQLQEVFDDPNKTVIVIAHRLSTIKMADRILVFDHGRLEENGSHEELMTMNGLYAQMFSEQTQVH